MSRKRVAQDWRKFRSSRNGGGLRRADVALRAINRRTAPQPGAEPWRKSCVDRHTRIRDRKLRDRAKGTRPTVRSHKEFVVLSSWQRERRPCQWRAEGGRRAGVASFECTAIGVGRRRANLVPGQQKIGAGLARIGAASTNQCEPCIPSGGLKLLGIGPRPTRAFPRASAKLATGVKMGFDQLARRSDYPQIATPTIDRLVIGLIAPAEYSWRIP
jgi:hypothetical protein